MKKDKRSVTSINVRRLRLVSLVLLAVGCGIAGYYLIRPSHAATYRTNKEAESATFGGNAGTVSSSTASSGSAARFGPPAVSGKRVFYEGFENGNLSQWDLQACPGGVSIVTSPTRKGGHSGKFTVSDGDTKAKCSQVPTENPRAQIVSPDLFHNGDEYYIADSIYFAPGLPAISDWFQLLELYGPPFGGSPPMGLDMCNNKMCFTRGAEYNYDQIWSMPSNVVTAKWYDVVLHVKFSTDKNTGFVEIYLDGVKQTMKNGSQRTNYDTLQTGVNWDGTADDLFLNQYRSTAPLGTVTLYHDEAAVGTTYDSVAP